MRFFTAAIALMAGSAIAAPAQATHGVLGGVGDVVDNVEHGLGLDQIEQQLDLVMAGSFQKIESALPLNLAEKLQSLMASGMPTTIVQTVGQSLNMVEHGVAIETVDAYLKSVTDGMLESLDSTLGLDHVEKLLHL